MHENAQMAMVICIIYELNIDYPLKLYLGNNVRAKGEFIIAVIAWRVVLPVLVYSTKNGNKPQLSIFYISLE